MKVEELPLAKLFVMVLQRMGVETDKFGDSNEVIAL